MIGSMTALELGRRMKSVEGENFGGYYVKHENERLKAWFGEFTPLGHLFGHLNRYLVKQVYLTRFPAPRIFSVTLVIARTKAERGTW